MKHTNYDWTYRTFYKLNFLIGIMVKKNSQLEKRRMKNVYVLSAIALILVLIAILFINLPKEQKEEISSFEDCIDAGYLVMESYPRQCRTSEGKTFVESIGGSALDFSDVTNALQNPKKTEKEEYLLQDEKSFKEIFGENILDIDFNESTLIAIFGGQKSSGGHSMSVRRVEEKENVLKVYVSEMSPGKGCFYTMAQTYPFVVVQIQKTDPFSIEFFYEPEVKDC